jgi:hypothetical protein
MVTQTKTMHKPLAVEYVPLEQRVHVDAPKPESLLVSRLHNMSTNLAYFHVD